MNYLALACLFATTSVFIVKECVTLPAHNQHYVFDVDFDEDFQLSDSVHHRVPRRTGRGNSLDTWACETVIPLPDDIRAEFPLDMFYQKYTHAYGIPILSSNVSQDAALIRACYTVRFLLADRKDIRDAMFDQYGRVGVIAVTERTTQIPEHSHLDSDVYDDRARGLGGIPSIPISTNAEENLLCRTNYEDRWFREDVLVHEFAHAIHLISLDRIDPSFSTTLKNIWKMAKDENLFSNTYAITSKYEYFAEAVQTFFGVQTCSTWADGIHNTICKQDQLKVYDPRLYNLTLQVFPCMNSLVDRCNNNQALRCSFIPTLAANQVLKMNCDVSVTTEDPTTASTTEEIQTPDAGTTESSTFIVTRETTPESSSESVTRETTKSSSSTESVTRETTTSRSSTESVTWETTMSSSTESVTDNITSGSTTINPTETSTLPVTETSTENVTQGCENQPCTNGGVCIPALSGGFLCNCTTSWIGETCEQDKNECKDMTTMQECSAKGLLCVNQLDGYTCRCPLGEYKTGNLDSCKKGIIYGLTILILQYKSHLAEFTNDLNNSSSVEFMEHQTRIQILLNEAFGSLPGFIDAVVLSFFNGSIGFKAAVTYDSTSTVTPDDIEHVITASNPFMGSEYKADLNNINVQQVCLAGFCHNGGKCELSAEKYPSICNCPFGFDGDRCEIRTVTVEMNTDPEPAPPNTLAIAIIVISAIGIVIAIAVIIQCLRVWQRNKDGPSQSNSPVELRGVKYSKGSQRITT